MKKVLITGDSGLLGANLAYLWREKYSVTGVSRGGKGIKGTRHISADLSDAITVNAVISEVKPSFIVHTAALVPIEECENDPEKARLFNVDMTANITAEAKKVGACVAYISTDAFYQGEGTDMCSESCPLTLKSVYAGTKHEGELSVLDYERGLALRTNIYGCNLQDKASFSEWVVKSLIAGETLTMFTDVLYSPILVNDLAGVIERAMESGLSGLYNAGGTGSINKYDFGVYLKKALNIETGSIVPTSVKTFNFKAWRSTNMSMDNVRLKKALNMDIPGVCEGIDNLCGLLRQGYPSKLREAVN